MISYCEIAKIHKGHLDSAGVSHTSSLAKLVRENLATNQRIWKLEDTARARHLGDEHIAEAKRKIDLENHTRNSQIREIDELVYKLLAVKRLSSEDAFVSETPGMIIDRLAILQLKLDSMKYIVSQMPNDALSGEYAESIEYATDYMHALGRFFDRFMLRLEGRKAYFEIQRPLKIYNDLRVRRYINS